MLEIYLHLLIDFFKIRKDQNFVMAKALMLLSSSHFVTTLAVCL